MAKFIEVTEISTSNKECVNVDHIVYFYQDENSVILYLALNQAGIRVIHTAESYDQIKSAIGQTNVIDCGTYN